MESTTTHHSQSLNEFVAAGKAFVDLVKSLPDDQLDASPAPGEWSVREIVHHVADDGDAWCFAFKKAIANPGAPLRFEGFPGNERWAAALHYRSRPVTNALVMIATHRAVMAEVAACAPEDWSQSFVEIFDDKGASYGCWTIERIMAVLTEHIREHTAAIMRISDQHFGSKN